MPALQGMSSALIPLAIGMIRDTFPREKVTSGIGIVSATMGVGGSIGMIVTGLIADHTSSYRPEFWIATGAAAVGMVLVALSARDVGVRVGGRPDLLGAAFLAGLLVCLLLAISEGNDWGWSSARVLALGVGVAYAALGTLAVQHVPMDQSGIASGINSLVRTAGGSVSGAVTAAVLTAQTIPRTPGIPTEHAYVLCFAIATIGAGLAAAVTVVHGIRHKPTPHSIEALQTP
jgi:Major Facilitator Superfamily